MGILKTILRPFFLVVIFFLLLSITLAIAGTIFAGSAFMPISPYFISGPSLVGYLVDLSFIFTIGLPLLGLFYFVSKRIRKYTINTALIRGARFVWMTSLFVSLYGLVDTALDFRNSGEAISQYSYDLTADTINFNVTDPKAFYYGIFSIGDMRFTGNNLWDDDFHIIVTESADNKLHITRKVRANGNNKKNAMKYAEAIDHALSFDGSQLIIPSKYAYKRGDKVRDQFITYTIAVPVGTYVQFDSRVNRYKFNIKFAVSDDIPWEMQDYNWLMTSEGLVSNEWTQIRNYTKTEELSDFNTLNVRGNFYIEMVKGNKKSLEVSGHKISVEGVKIITQDGTVTIEEKNYSPRYPTKLVFTLPAISDFSTSTDKTVRMEGFAQENMNIVLTDNCKLTAYLDVKNLSITGDLVDAVTLTGQGDQLALDMNRNCNFNGGDYEIKTLLLRSYLNRGSFNVTESIKAKDAMDRRIKIYGDPEIIIGQEKNLTFNQ